MLEFPRASTMPTSSVDWRPAQDLYFRHVQAPYREIATALDVHENTVGRWATCAVPVPLHQAFLLAEVTQNSLLTDGHARRAQKLIVDRPHGIGGCIPMAILRVMEDEFHQLKKLTYLLEDGQTLTEEEQQRYRQLCEQIVRQVMRLPELIERKK